MMFSSLAIFLASFLVAEISASNLAQRIPVGNGLRQRVVTSGGFALKGLQCEDDNTQQCFGSAGFCCPSSLQCKADYSDGHHCCPQGTSCLSAYQASPQCADDSWWLWRQQNSKTGEGYFCCLPGQIGTNTGIGICVTPNTPVVASLSASLILGTATAAPSSTASGSAKSSASVATATTSAAKTTTATTATTATQPSTSTSSAAKAANTNGAGRNGLGVAGNLLPIALLAGGFALI